MTVPQLLVVIFALMALIPSVASLTKFDQWWVRGFDFPRLQISVLTLVILISAFLVLSFEPIWHFILILFLLSSFFYQASKIFPYTIFARKQVHQFVGQKKDARISILVSNVLTPNKNYHKLLELVRALDPDILLTLESDHKWERELSVLEKDYPHTVKIPQENLYGMHLYSKLVLSNTEIKFLISEEVPSIHGMASLRDGQKVNFHCLHPKPPSPTEDDTSTNRDAELLLVGKRIKNQKATLVLGDLNDVAWSRTTRLFQKISGLLDPRIGRGFYNTYHAGIPVFRWPLDHVFNSQDFTLVRLKRLKGIGSDHFPIFIELNHQPALGALNDQPENPEVEEKEWADEKIEKGR